MIRAEEYMQRAAEADAQAEKTSDPMLKAQFRKTANQWRELARWAGYPRQIKGDDPPTGPGGHSSG